MAGDDYGQVPKARPESGPQVAGGQSMKGRYFHNRVPASAPCEHRLETPDMSYLQAYNHLEQLKPNQPWLTELEFLHAVLAHLSMFHEETAKNTYSGATLHRLIVNVASPTKFQWLLNDTRYRHSVPRERLVLLPSGTTSNESLHHELNHWFRETVTRLQTIYVMCNSYTVVLGYSRRMLEGGDAQGHPDPETGILPVCQRSSHTIRPCITPCKGKAGQSEISRRAFSANIEMILPVRAWTKWCRNLAKPGAIPKKAALRVVQDGKRVRALTKSSKAVSASKTSTRKGKKLAPPLPKSAPTRRTPFRLRNVSPIIRPGLRSKRI